MPVETRERSEKFDAYQDRYAEAVERATGFVGCDLAFFTEAKIRWLLEIAEKRIDTDRTLRVLDFGCGVGQTDSYLVSHFDELHGLDVSSGVLEEASRRNPSVRYSRYDGSEIPFEDAYFDLVFAICVLHHIPPPEWDRVAAELRRVTRPGGVVAVFEHNPLNPLTRLSVARCEFDDDAVLLGKRTASRLLTEAGLEVVDARYILFFPIRAAVAARAERALGWLPLGAQYFVAGRAPFPPASGSGVRGRVPSTSRSAVGRHSRQPTP